jgi:hypothetical protein
MGENPKKSSDLLDYDAPTVDRDLSPVTANAPAPPSVHAEPHKVNRLRHQWTLRRWQIIAILVVAAMAAGAIGVASRQSELNDLRDKNTALARDKVARLDENAVLAHDKAALRGENVVLAHDKAALRDANAVLAHDKAGLQEKLDVFGLPHGDVPVSETGFRIVMPTSLHAGHHTIALTNNGEGHELLLFRTDLGAAVLPVDTKGDVIEDSPLLHKVLDSGGSPESNQSLPVTLDPGHYVAICNLPGHYGLGMRLDIAVSR